MADGKPKVELETRIKVLIDSLEIFKYRLDWNDSDESKIWDAIDECIEKLSSQLKIQYEPPRFERW